jgi:hypothetical protein
VLLSHGAFCFHSEPEASTAAEETPKKKKKKSKKAEEAAMDVKEDIFLLI